MKLMNFLKDKKSLILFYFILMSFISSVIYFDNTVKISLNNVIYINIVCFVLLLLYLLYEFFMSKRYYELLHCTASKENENIVFSLPKPLNNEQTFYHNLLIKINEEYNSKLETYYRSKKENIDFINSWVHEIKTPISVCRLLIENSLNKPKEEILNSIDDEINSIENFVEQALYYSRTDDFSKDYLINDIDIHALVNQVIKKHAKEFITKKIKIELNTLDIEISSDKKWLFFIIDQILSNSLKYTNNNGLIKVIGASYEKEKLIIIEDNGIGIKTEDIDRVFDKGFTGTNGREHYKSTGLGLYLSKNLAIKLGHDISIKSAYGKYTQVTIHFPKLLDYYKITK